MPVMQLVDQFLSTLNRSKLLPEEKLREVTAFAQSGSFQSAEELAAALIRRGDLTRFQVDRLLEGRHRGFQVGPYRLEDVLGAGGMGWLYLAKHQETGDNVALKVLADRHKHEPAMRARFQLEARAGTKLQHPQIVKTYALDHLEDLYGSIDYMVMEFVKGINLQEFVDRKGAMPWGQACDVVCQGASALEYAHRQGMVHRDVKPANFLISADGSVKILDFGLALVDRYQQKEEDRDEFSLAMIFGQDCLGTDDYISPEQTRDSQHVDGRADIYSLGCTLYFLIAAKVPFPLKSVKEKLEAHRELPPPDIRKLVPEVPAELAAILMKMMSKKPADRYSSMQQVVQALSPYARRLPIDFDWNQVLARRAKEARLRLAGQRARQHPASHTGSSTARSESSAARIQIQSLETAVGQDTNSVQQSPSAIKLDRPFEPYAQELTKLASAHTIRTGTLPPVREPHGHLIPSGHGPCIPLSKDCIVIGRHAHCDVQVLSPRVSSQHCELRREGSQWRVTDLNSTNGIRVNGQAVKSVILKSGDRLSISPEHDFQITFEKLRRPRLVWKLLVLGMCIALAAAIGWWYLGR